MTSNRFVATGLTDEQVKQSKALHGSNKLTVKKQSGFLSAVINMAKEPMFLLLVIAATVYFISGNASDGVFMLSAIVLVSAISIYQDSRSRNALAALRELTEPTCKVLRNGVISGIKTEDVVVGDCILVEEGAAVPADGEIIEANDFSVNESMLTGESMAVSKGVGTEDAFVYQGTTVVSGRAMCSVSAIGDKTKLGKIGVSLLSVKEEVTPLQKSINNFVRAMAIVGTVIFVLVWVLNYLSSKSITDSLLKALTLAMSILPEELPVAFTTFMALGAWRLMKMGIIVKQTGTVETLGSATVICTDKTGTITENRMSLAKLFVLSSSKTSAIGEHLGEEEKELVRLAMWSSEQMPFDPMEIAVHEAYGKLSDTDERPDFKMVHEYALGGVPPMMTHVLENNKGRRIIAAKGAPEAIMNVSDIREEEKTQIVRAVDGLAAQGYRVLGVGEAQFADDNFPASQQELRFCFKGLVAFLDPPKENIRAVFEAFYKAGIAVKIITGDNAATTATIAKQVGFRGAEHTLGGQELIAEKEQELEENVLKTNIFTRMFPEAKLRIIKALKAKGQIVAMTGDGVNDGPALKAAHIGIAMGKRGSEIARQASALILADDDLGKMVDAVAMGRKIYANLKKAMRYIISIHIPIILAVLLPLALGWIYPNIFSPIHIIFFELIMAPTCSIIYENEPMEKNAMLLPPRPFETTFFTWNELAVSIVQGLAITAGVLATYQYAVQHGNDEPTTRTMVFVTLIAANIFLTLVNRSFYYSILTTAAYKNPLVPIIVAVTIALSAVILFVPPVTHLFQLATLQWTQIGISCGIGFVSVTWYEVVKVVNRKRKHKDRIL